MDVHYLWYVAAAAPIVALLAVAGIWAWSRGTYERRAWKKYISRNDADGPM